MASALGIDFRGSHRRQLRGCRRNKRGRIWVIGRTNKVKLEGMARNDKGSEEMEIIFFGDLFFFIFHS